LTIVLASTSLFDAANEGSVPAAIAWLNGTLLGTVATGLAIMAVAFIGFTMLSGRLAIRDGIRVIIGCFVLFGASYVASSLSALAYGGTRTQTIVAPPTDLAPRAELPPADYDPYAGASLRNDSNQF